MNSDADSKPDYYLMQIQVTKIMWIRRQILIQNYGLLHIYDTWVFLYSVHKVAGNKSAVWTVWKWSTLHYSSHQSWDWPPAHQASTLQCSSHQAGTGHWLNRTLQGHVGTVGPHCSMQSLISSETGPWLLLPLRLCLCTRFVAAAAAACHSVFATASQSPLPPGSVSSLKIG
jgi:hypothetical protein